MICRSSKDGYSALSLTQTGLQPQWLWEMPEISEIANLIHIAQQTRCGHCVRCPIGNSGFSPAAQPTMHQQQDKQIPSSR